MQKVWEVLDEVTDVVKISILADTTAYGVTISHTPNWQSINDINHIISILSTAASWLVENEGVK